MTENSSDAVRKRPIRENEDNSGRSLANHDKKPRLSHDNEHKAITITDPSNSQEPILENDQGNEIPTPEITRSTTPTEAVPEQPVGRPLIKKKIRKKKDPSAKSKLSFFDDDSDGEDDGNVSSSKPIRTAKKATGGQTTSGKPITVSDPNASTTSPYSGPKIMANASVAVVPRALTKSALRREAEEREALRLAFQRTQARVKASEFAIPFVFYDGTNLPGGTVRMTKGDYIVTFLDKARKVGAESSSVRRHWARTSVSDLLLVRGTMIIPHHYDFYYFIFHRTKGPENVILFDYKHDEPDPSAAPDSAAEPEASSSSGPTTRIPLLMHMLEGAEDDATFTKVVDRRWYERNKHIYPATLWQEFDPDKDYQTDVRRDADGNTFFYS